MLRSLMLVLRRRWLVSPDPSSCISSLITNTDVHSFVTSLAPIPSTPYTSLTLGVPLETYPSERRVALTPSSTSLLLKKGFKSVLVERGAGSKASFTDEMYERAGARVVERDEVWSSSDVLVKVRLPREGTSPSESGESDSVEGREGGEKSELERIKEGTKLVSFVYPVQNKDVVQRLAERGVTLFAMDLIRGLVGRRFLML